MKTTTRKLIAWAIDDVRDVYITCGRTAAIAMVCTMVFFTIATVFIVGSLAIAIGGLVLTDPLSALVIAGVVGIFAGISWLAWQVAVGDLEDDRG